MAISRNTISRETSVSRPSRTEVTTTGRPPPSRLRAAQARVSSVPPGRSPPWACPRATGRPGALRNCLRPGRPWRRTLRSVQLLGREVDAGYGGAQKAGHLPCGYLTRPAPTIATRSPGVSRARRRQTCAGVATASGTTVAASGSRSWGTGTTLRAGRAVQVSKGVSAVAIVPTQQASSGSGARRRPGRRSTTDTTGSRPPPAGQRAPVYPGPVTCTMPAAGNAEEEAGSIDRLPDV